MVKTDSTSVFEEATPRTAACLCILGTSPESYGDIIAVRCSTSQSTED